MIVTTATGSALTHFFEEGADAKNLGDSIDFSIGNSVHAQETDRQKDDTQLDANHTFTTSLNTHTPSTVIDQNILPKENPTSQSPQEEEESTESDYIDILADLVPVSGDDIDYETILGISQEEIKRKIEILNLSIWDIAYESDETDLLEKAYYAVYPARIIGILESGIITQEMADVLIEKAMHDISNHRNISIELMIENLIHTN